MILITCSWHFCVSCIAFYCMIFSRWKSITGYNFIHVLNFCFLLKSFLIPDPCQWTNWIRYKWSIFYDWSRLLSNGKHQRFFSFSYSLLLWGGTREQQPWRSWNISSFSVTSKVLLAPHKDGTKQGQRFSHSIWSLVDIRAAIIFLKKGNTLFQIVELPVTRKIQLNR